MCVQYWPASKDKDECYGELPEYQIHIGVMKEEELANFHIRTFRIYKMHNNVRFFYLFLMTLYSTQQEIIFFNSQWKFFSFHHHSPSPHDNLIIHI